MILNNQILNMDSSFITDNLSSFNKEGALKHGLPSWLIPVKNFIKLNVKLSSLIIGYLLALLMNLMNLAMQFQ